MRLGVLDIGSNTVHLLVVDAHRGAPPIPAYSHKAQLKLTAHLLDGNRLSDECAASLRTFIVEALQVAEDKGVEDLMAFATSAVRDAVNGEEILEGIRGETGVGIDVLSGEAESRLTFLAVRRWFGWSAGRLLVLDIGGGSLEIAAGIDETPDGAMSLPPGAGRPPRDKLGVAPDPSPPPPVKAVDELQEYVHKQLDSVVSKLSDMRWDRAVATSKTFRTLARLAGAAPSRQGLWEPRALPSTGLRQVLGFIRLIPACQVCAVEGGSARRSHQ